MNVSWDGLLPLLHEELTTTDTFVPDAACKHTHEKVCTFIINNYYLKISNALNLVNLIKLDLSKDISILSKTAIRPLMTAL